MPTNYQKSLHKGLFSFPKAARDRFFADAQLLLKAGIATVLISNFTGENSALLISVSRTVGNAVTRNRLRRLCKALFLETNLPLNRHILAIIFKRKLSVDRPTISRLFSQVEKHLRSIKPTQDNHRPTTQ